MGSGRPALVTGDCAESQPRAKLLDRAKLPGKMPSVTPRPPPLARDAVSPWLLERGSWATRSPTGRRFLQTLAASVVVHALLTPFPAWLGLLGAIGQVEELPPEDELTGIPVDLIADEPLAEPAAPPPPASPTLPPPAPSEPTIVPSEPAPAPPNPAPTEPVPPEQPPSEPKPKADSGDPVALAGAAGKLADSNANVRILLYTDVVRSHPLGPRIGGLMRRSPQWADFFGPTSVDPIRDIDRVLIAGPELRDTKNMVAVIGHRLSEDEIDRALERLVDRNGEWISRSPRLARATADRATRLFAAPRPGIVAVAPPSATRSLARLGRRLAFPEAPPGTAAFAYVVKPSRPLRAVGLRLPESIEWLKVRVVPRADGGATLELDAKDESEAAALEHAQSLQTLLRRASEIDLSRMGAVGALAAFALGGTKQKVVETIELSGRGDHIVGSVLITARQLQNLADLLDAVLPPPSADPVEPAPAPAPAPAAESDEAQSATEGTAEPRSDPERPSSGGTTGDSEPSSPAPAAPAAPDPAP